MNSYPWKKLPQVDPERIAAVVDLTALQAVEGYVWCDKYGEVHSDSLNPYGYNEHDPLTAAESLCTDNDHRALYMEPDDAKPIDALTDPGAPFVCRCDCHLPLGFTLRPGQVAPPGMRACVYCASKHP